MAAQALRAQCAATEPVATNIPDAQGEGPLSPCAGRVVTVTGVETVSLPYGHILADSSLASVLLQAGYSHFNADCSSGDNSQSPVRAANHDTPWAAFR